jgi:hypothetical protein
MRNRLRTPATLLGIIIVINDHSARGEKGSIVDNSRIKTKQDDS